VAAVVHSLCTRATRARWLAVLLPTAVWLAWRVALVPPESGVTSDRRPPLPELVDGALRHAAESFRYLALGNRALGVVLLCLFVAHAAWRIRGGLAAAANVLAWSAALLFWWFGLMWSRWLLVDATPAFRYHFVSVGFILLAVLPPGRIALPMWATASTRRSAMLATSGVLLVATVLGVSVRPDAQEFARLAAANGRLAQGQAAVALDPGAAIPDGVGFGFTFANMTAGEVRHVLDTYGSHVDPGGTDGLLVDIGAVRLMSGLGGPAPKACRDLGGPVDVGPADRVQLYARAGTSDVDVRRFGREWLPVGRLADGHRATLLLPSYRTGERWEVRGQGVCVVGPRS
jgi:hypothetical protein